MDPGGEEPEAPSDAPNAALAPADGPQQAAAGAVAAGAAEPPAAAAQQGQDEEDIEHSDGGDDEEDGWISEGEGEEGDWLDAGQVDGSDEDWEGEDGEGWSTDEGGEWVQGGGGDDSSSSDEPPAEEGEAQQLAADTAGVHVCPEYAAYHIPTIAHHFQSADSLSVSELPGPHGGLLAAIFDSNGVAVWLLPPASGVTSLGAGSQPAAERLGGFQAPRDIYSSALSPCGHWLATGGKGGLLTLYSVDPTAPPRPPLSTPAPLEGINYFYQPQAPGEIRVMHIHVDDGPGLGLPSLDAEQRQIHDLLAGFAPKAIKGEQRGTGGPPRAALMLRGIYSLGLDAAQAKQVPFLIDGMTNGVRWGVVAGRLRLLAADQNHYVYVFEHPDAGAAAAAENAPSSSSCSSGSWGGWDLRAEQMLVGSLGEASPHWGVRPVNFFSTQQHAAGARVSQQHRPPEPGDHGSAEPALPPEPRPQRAAAAAASAAWQDLARGGPVKAGACSYGTVTLGPFPVPCNLAAASPDGRWVAVVGDSQALYLVDQQAGYSWRTLAFDLAGSHDRVEEGLEAGAQYVAWNASSSLLALTSDALHAVFVFEPTGGRMVLRVEGHARPCLCLGWAPWDDRLLVYAEQAKHVHLRRVPSGAEAADGCVEQHAVDDLGDATAGYQLLRLPIMGAHGGGVVHAGNRRRRINGMAMTRQGDLLVATRQAKLLRFLGSHGWTHEQHTMWPPAFRAAARTLLLCAHRQAAGSGGQAGLWSLPLPVLQHVVALAAGQRSDWLPQSEPPPPPGGSGEAAALADGGAATDGGEAAAAVAGGQGS